MKPVINLPLVVTVLSWGFNFVAIKVLYTEFLPPALAFLRYAATFLLLIAFCLWRKESLRPAKEDFWRIQAAGLVAMGIYMILFLKGMEGTTPAEGAIVLATSPIFTYLLSCLLKQEAFDLGALGASAMAFFGVTLVITGGAAAGHGSLVANLTVLASSVVWAISAVMMKPLLAKYRALPLFTMSMPGALLPMAAYGGFAVTQVNYAAVDAKGWWMFAFVTVMSGCVAFVCFYRGIAEIGAGAATMYQYFVPVMAAFFAWVVMGKALLPVQYLGFAVVLASVIASGRARTKAAKADILRLRTNPEPDSA